MSSPHRTSKLTAATLVCIALLGSGTPLVGATGAQAGGAAPGASVGSWTTRDTEFSGRAWLAAAVGPDGKIYSFGGSITRVYPNQLNTVEVYDPGSETTSRVAPMPRIRDGLAAAFGSDGRLYVFGGGGQNREAIADVDAYDPASGEWSTPTQMPMPRQGLAAVAGLDGRIYTLGGQNEDGGISDAVEVFDPTSGTWRELPHLGTPRALLAATTDTNGRIFAIGGIGANGGLSSVEAMDPPFGTDEPDWYPLTSMTTPRSGLAAASGPDRVYALGGSSSNQLLGTVEVFDRATDTWRSLAAMPTPRAGFAAATDASGRVYALGGYRPSGLALEYPSQVDVFDPMGGAWTAGAGTWTAGPPMLTGREGAAATVGKDGQLYVVGGFSDVDGAPLSTVETYNPAGGGASAWGQAPPMPTSRAFLAAATSADGRIYAIGGARGDSGVPDPSDAPILAVGCRGGTCDDPNRGNLADGTYAVRYAWQSEFGTTRGSPVARILAIDGESITVSLPVPPPNVISTDIYLTRENGLDCELWLPAVTTAETTALLTSHVEGSWDCALPDADNYGATEEHVWPNTNSTAYLKTVEVYTPATRSWDQFKPLPAPAWGMAAVQAANGNLYVFGGAGANGQVFTSLSVLIYPADQTSWFHIQEMPGGGRVLLAAVLGADKRIYILGGNTGGNRPGIDTLDRVEIYDPATLRWTGAAPMLTPRQGLAAVATPDGKIYAIGGSNGTSTHLTTAEVYDPASNTWTPIASLPSGLRNLTGASATVGGISRIFMFGGHGDSPTFNSVNIFTP